jgi:hypothetical protein
VLDPGLTGACDFSWVFGLEVNFDGGKYLIGYEWAIPFPHEEGVSVFRINVASGGDGTSGERESWGWHGRNFWGMRAGSRFMQKLSRGPVVPVRR